MKLFSKSFFLLLLEIMLFSTGSAMAAALSSGTEDCQSLCSSVSCSAWTSGTSTPTSQVTFTAPSGITVVAPLYTNSCTSAGNGGVDACKTGCEATKTNIINAKIAYNKAKLDPMSDAKYDTEDQGFSRVMCQALKVVTGSAGKTFASFAIIATGIGFFTGKVSWGLMIGVTAGIATMFGAPSIVAAISGQDTTMKCNVIMPN